MKVCPVCGKRYEDEVLFCPADGAGLVPAADGSAASSVAATVAQSASGSGAAQAPRDPVTTRRPAPSSGPQTPPPRIPATGAAVGQSAAATAAASRSAATSGSGMYVFQAPQPDPNDPLIGSRIFGHYVITKKLGEGGMGAVYMAQNPEIEQTIAIKVLHGHAAQNEELVKRFNREAKVICKLTHPNIIRVFIFGHTPTNMIFLAMEYVEGGTLRDVIEKEGQLDALRAIDIMRQCLHALEEAHELGIVHRDLKPDNIMLTNFRKVDEFVKVLDFGIAKIKDQPGSQNQKLTQAGVVYGTPEYLSPEQAQAKELDGRSDLYSMGVILYEMLTGCVPFHSSTAVAILAAHVYDEPEPPSKVAKKAIHPKFDTIIKKALSKKPEERYATAMDFLADLEDVESELTAGAATKTTVLDASQLSLVLEVSRAAQILRESGAKADAPLPSPPPMPVAAQPAAAAPVQQPAAGDQNQLMILKIVIAGLIVLLLMVFAALLYVNKQRRSASLDVDRADTAFASVDDTWGDPPVDGAIVVEPAPGSHPG